MDESNQKAPDREREELEMVLQHVSRLRVDGELKWKADLRSV